MNETLKVLLKTFGVLKEPTLTEEVIDMALLEELQASDMPTSMLGITLKDTDVIPSNKLHIYPYNDGEKMEQRILYGYGSANITSEYYVLSHYISVSHGDILAKSVQALPAGRSKLGKTFGNTNYDIRGYRPFRYDSGLPEDKIQKLYTVAELKELEKQLNNNFYDENRVLEPADIKMAEKGSTSVKFKDDKVVTVNVYDTYNFYDLIAQFARFSKMTGSTYTLVRPYIKNKVQVTVTPDCDTHAVFDDYLKQTKLLSETGEIEEYKALQPKKEETPRRELTEEEKEAIDEKRRQVSVIYEARQERLRVQTTGRMFTAIDPARWIAAIKACDADKDAKNNFNTIREWAVLMEDAMQKGYALEQCAVPYLEDLTICKLSNVYGDRNLYDNVLFGYASLLVPFWVYGEQLKEYVNKVASKTEADHAHILGKHN